MRLIDASSYQGRPNWRAVARQGHIVGAWLKATEATSWGDPDFAVNRDAAARAGIHVGAYHFARPGLNMPEAEAAHFVSVVRKLRLRELRPVLDYELPTSFTPAQTLDWIQDFGHSVRTHLGVFPIFYSYPDLIAHLGLKAPVGSGLWLASYGVNDGKLHHPVIPFPWRKLVAQQFTSNGVVPGISGRVDISEARSLTPLLAHPVLGHLPRPLPHLRGGGASTKAV